MPQSPRFFAGALCAVLFTPSLLPANPTNVHVARHWHLHQPIYWPEWNSNGVQTQRYQYAWDSLQMKFTNGNRYDGSAVRHPQNNLVNGDPEGSFDAVFSPEDRIKAYQAGPKESLGRITNLPYAGYSMSYSGSLIENVNSFGRNNAYGYSANWNQNFIDIRNWRNQSGQRRHDLVGFTYHHSFGPLIPKSVLRKELQIFKEVYWKTWAGQPDKSDHSKGFWPSEAAFSRHMVDVLADEKYEWVIVANSHLTRTVQNFDAVAGLGNITSNIDPPNRADRLGPTIPANQWWSGNKDGRGAWQAAPFAYQAHKVQYVNPTNGAVKKITVVPMDDVISYLLGYERTGIDAIPKTVVDSARDPNRPLIVLAATDGENAYGGGYNSWQMDTPEFMRQAHTALHESTVIQKFVDDHPVPDNAVVHIEDGAWFNAANDWGHPQFVNWLYPPVSTDPAKINNLATRYDFETPGFAEDFRNWAVLMAGANWMETAEQIYKELNGDESVQVWRIQEPYQPNGTFNSPNAVERGWHIFLAGFDSGFMYYGDSLDDEVKQSLASNRAISQVKSLVESNASLDRTPPTIFKPQRFPWNPGGRGWGPLTLYRPVGFNGVDPWPSEFYIWSHVYDVSDVQSVTLRIRVDNDGTNSLSDNQNETFDGGSGVGAWIDIPMQKRVLPRGNPTGNANLNFFIRPDHMADYYFAKITDQNVQNFRGKLLDYYVRAVDGRGNISNSDIQHVFVEDDGETPSSGAQFSANPNNCEPVTVTYSAANGPLEGIDPVYVQLRFNDGAWTRHAMSSSLANVWTYTFDAPADAASATVCFENGDGSVIDSRDGQNWTTSIRDCNAPDGPVWTVPFTPVAGQPVTIHYNPAGRVLASAQSVNIHHGYNGGNWTTVPGVPMTKSGDIWTFTYTVPAQATSLAMVFNNNSGVWDNNSNQNFVLAVSSAPPATDPPPVPAGLSVSGVTAASVTLAWSAVETATGYSVFRNGQQVGSPSATTFTDTGLEPETAYSYRVSATNGAGDSGPSAAVSATTLPAPVTPTQIVVLDPSSAGPVPGSSYLFRGRAGSAFTNGLAWSNPLTGGNGLIAFPGGSVGNGWEWTSDIALGPGGNQVTFSGSYDISATQNLTDSPANYSGWTNGATGGTGFAAWSLTTSGTAGHFLAAKTAHPNMDVGSAAGFGLYANSGGTATAARNFNTPMAVGDSFALRFDNNWVESGGETGFALTDNAGAVKLRFYFANGFGNYRITDAVAARDSGLAYTSDGLNLTVTLTSANTYTLSTGSTTLTGTLASAGGPISRLVVENKNAGSGTERNLYIGAMTHTRQLAEAGTVSINAPVLTSGAALSDFDQWRGDEPATEQLLLDYAIGGAAAPGEAGEEMRVTRDESHLLMTAVVRTGDASLVVTAEATGDLAEWSSDGVEMVDDSDQTGLPAGFVRKVVRVPLEGGRRFVRLKATHAL